MEYTEQEIEMLARFASLAYAGASEPWRGRAVKSFVNGTMLDCEPLRAFRAILPLMREAREQGLATARDEIRKAGEREQATWDQLVRDAKEAREQGAAEMRERAAELVRIACHDHPSTREILANIRALSLAVPS